MLWCPPVRPPGKFEALELRDGDKGNYTGLSVQRAVENVNTKIAEAVAGRKCSEPDLYRFSSDPDRRNPDNKSNLGANATR